MTIAAHDLAVIFDMDGVLTDTTALHCRSWCEAAARRGWRFEPADYDAMRGLAREESLRVFLDVVGRHMTGAERAGLAQPALQQAVIEEKQRLFLEYTDALTAADRLAGVTALIDGLRARRVPLAVGSSSRNAELVLRRIGLREAFAVVVDGNDVPISKPAPAIFLECARRLGAAAERCIVIEDAASGIEAARAAQMKCVGVGPADRLAGATLVVSSLALLSVDSLFALLGSPRGA